MSNHLLNESGLENETQSKTHSFIVKLWLEDFDPTHKRAVWRGHITHIPNGTRRYLQHLAEIISFIVPYLEEMDVRVALPWRLIQWFQNLMRFLFGEEAKE